MPLNGLGLVRLSDVEWLRYAAVRPNVMTFGVGAFLDAFTMSLQKSGPGGFMFVCSGRGKSICTRCSVSGSLQCLDQCCQFVFDMCKNQGGSMPFACLMKLPSLRPEYHQ